VHYHSLDTHNPDGREDISAARGGLKKPAHQGVKGAKKNTNGPGNAIVKAEDEVWGGKKRRTKPDTCNHDK